MISKKQRKFFTVIIIVATIALVASSLGSAFLL